MRARGRLPSFRLQITSAMALLLVLPLSFAAFYFPSRLEREAVTLMSYKMNALLELTAFTIHPAVFLGDSDALDEALSATRKDADVAYVIVAANDGILTRFHGERASAEALRRTTDGAALSPDGSLYEGMKTIREGDRPIARLYVGLSLGRLRQEIHDARVALGIGSMAVLAAAVIGVIAISSYLTRPLRAVAVAAESITSGRTREPVRVEGSAELRRLAESFNAMVAQLELRASELRTSRDELRRLSKKILSVQEEERVMISREIHDELGQALTILKMEIQNVAPHRVPEDVAASLCAAIDSLIELVRRIAAELRPLVLDDLGLRAALEHHIRRLNEKAGLPVTLLAPETLDLDRLTASTVLRIVREALSNVVRHAAASTAAVKVEVEESSIVVEVRDNGIGFDPARIEAPESLGLTGIRERALLLGGSAAIRTARGKGTTIRVTLPRASEKEELR